MYIQSALDTYKTHCHQPSVILQLMEFINTFNHFIPIIEFFQKGTFTLLFYNRIINVRNRFECPHVQLLYCGFLKQ